jgi:hypothetical protein
MTPLGGSGFARRLGRCVGQQLPYERVPIIVRVIAQRCQRVVRINIRTLMVVVAAPARGSVIPPTVVPICPAGQCILDTQAGQSHNSGRYREHHDRAWRKASLGNDGFALGQAARREASWRAFSLLSFQ